jgi:ABC-type sugar transport system permease subunit
MSVTPMDATTEEQQGKRKRRTKKGGDEPDHRIDPGATRRAWMLLAPTIAALSLVIIYPVVRAIYMSFQADQHLDPTTGLFVAGGFAGFDNYTHWLGQRCNGQACATGEAAGYFWDVVFITFMFAFVTVVFETVLGFWFATIMNKKFRGRGLLRAAVLIPWAIPTAVTAKLWYFIFAYDGIANHLFGVHILWTGDQWPARFAIIIADTWKTTPFMALLILAGLQLISNDVYEAARVDGASVYQRFRYITLPLVRPALMVAILFRSLDALRMFDLPFILTGGGGGTGHATTTLSILVVRQYQVGFNGSAAISTITFLLVFLVAFIFIKFLGANVVETEESYSRKK